MVLIQISRRVVLKLLPWSEPEGRPPPIPHPMTWGVSGTSTSQASLPWSDVFLEQLTYSDLPKSPRFLYLWSLIGPSTTTCIIILCQSLSNAPQLRDIWIVSALGNHKQSCYEHLCADFCVNINFYLSGISAPKLLSGKLYTVLLRNCQIIFPSGWTILWSQQLWEMQFLHILISISYRRYFLFQLFQP